MRRCLRSCVFLACSVCDSVMLVLREGQAFTSDVRVWPPKQIGWPASPEISLLDVVYWPDLGILLVCPAP